MNGADVWVVVIGEESRDRFGGEPRGPKLVVCWGPKVQSWLNLERIDVLGNLETQGNLNLGSKEITRKATICRVKEEASKVRDAHCSPKCGVRVRDRWPGWSGVGVNTRAIVGQRVIPICEGPK